MQRAAFPDEWPVIVDPVIQPTKPSASIPLNITSLIPLLRPLPVTPEVEEPAE
jgi:hypothetical protein